MIQTGWKSAYFTIHPSKNPPPHNGFWLKSVYFYLKNTGFTSFTFPIQLNFSQNQLAAITLNAGSPRTLSRIVSSILELQIVKTIISKFQNKS